MEDTKLNIRHLLGSIFKSFAEPVIAVDSQNVVIESNNPARSLLKIESENSSLTELLDVDTFEKIQELIQSAIENKSYITFNDILLRLKNKKEIRINLNINLISTEDEYLVLLTFNQIDSGEILLNFTKIDIRSGNSIDFFLNSELRSVLNEIKSSFPFTVTSKERLRKFINEKTEPIRIKDGQGKFMIVNQAYADSIGITISQVEGKIESDLMPDYAKGFLNAIHQYLRDTHNCVIMEGLPVKGISDNISQQIIEIPICDYQNTILAIVSITQQKSSSVTSEVNAELYLSGDIIEIFPKPLTYIDNEARILYSSVEFCKLLSENSGTIRGRHISEILPTEFVEVVKSFQLSSSSASTFYVQEAMIPCDQMLSDYSVLLKKISLNVPDQQGVLIFVDESQNNHDLDQIIKQRGKMFDILVQNNPEPIYIYDIDNLRFLEVNEAALRLYGYSKDEFLQMDLTDLYTPEDIQTLLGSSEASNSASFAGPFRHKTKSGESLFVEISKIKFKFNDRDSFFNIIKDITSQLELSKKSQLFKAAFENTSDVILVTDSNGFINFINKSGSEKLGFSLQEVQNTSFSALVRDEDRGMINTTVFNPDLKDETKLSLDIKKADSGFLNFYVKFIPVFDYSDKIEAYTILLKENIDNTTGEQNDEGNVVIKEVYVEKPVQLDPVLPDPNFLSGVFHEILTPMNVILGFAQELSDSIESPSSDQKEASELINQNKVKLLNTMNSVVEYSELLQNKSEFTYSELAITDLIDKIDKKISDLINTPDTQFSYGKISSSLTLITDPNKFDILITSIIKIVGRIIKEKKIYLSAFPYDDDQFIILICDNYNSCSEYLASKLKLIFTGNNDLRDIGSPKLTTHLAKTLLPKLGGKFISDDDYGGGFVFPLNASGATAKKQFESVDDKIDSLTEKEQVQGLLEEIDTEQEIVHKDTDHLSVESEPVVEAENNDVLDQESNEPSELSIEATGISAEEFSQSDSGLTEEPLEMISSETAVTKESRGALDLASLSCLYIEDQVDSQILFKVQMKGLKEIKFAVSFEEALPLLEKRTFDFIVMDINLQGEYNGLDALKIINKMPAHESTPIIAVTAYVLPGDKEKFIATGFNDFVSKPIFREKMVESLERIFPAK